MGSSMPSVLSGIGIKVGILVPFFCGPSLFFLLTPIWLLGLSFLPLVLNFSGVILAIGGGNTWPLLIVLFPALFLTIPWCFSAIPVSVILFLLSPLWFLIGSFLIPVATILTSIVGIVVALAI